jgi:hypothetical protein
MTVNITFFPLWYMQNYITFEFERDNFERPMHTIHRDASSSLSSRRLKGRSVQVTRHMTIATMLSFLQIAPSKLYGTHYTRRRRVAW